MCLTQSKNIRRVWFKERFTVNKIRTKVSNIHKAKLQRWQWLFSSWDPKTYILKMNIWIELIIWILIVMQQFLVRLISYSLTFKWWVVQLYFLFTKKLVLVGPLKLHSIVWDNFWQLKALLKWWNFHVKISSHSQDI